MLFLLLAIFSSSMISIVMRFSSGKITGNLSMLATNYFICSFLGAAYAGFDLAAAEDPGFSRTVVIGLISGVLYLAAFVAFQTNTNKRGVVLSSVFMKLGLLVPIVASVLFFKELPTAVQIIGFCIAIFAILLINLRNDGRGKGFGFGLILMLLLSGGADVMAKIFDVFAPQAHSALYLFYNFATAFTLCVLLVIQKKERPGLRELLYGALIGIPNFFSAKFLLASLTKLPAVVVYPSFSVGTMLIVTMIGVLVFRERLSNLQWGAMGAIVAALILLNI